MWPEGRRTDDFRARRRQRESAAIRRLHHGHAKLGAAAQLRLHNQLPHLGVPLEQRGYKVRGRGGADRKVDRDAARAGGGLDDKGRLLWMQLLDAINPGTQRRLS